MPKAPNPSNPKQGDPAQVSFEKDMQQLEKLVQKMQQGDSSLEQSLQWFEQGVGLVQSCQKSLHGAEQKVQILMQDMERQTAELQPFADSDLHSNQPDPDHESENDLDSDPDHNSESL